MRKLMIPSIIFIGLASSCGQQEAQETQHSETQGVFLNTMRKIPDWLRTGRNIPFSEIVQNAKYMELLKLIEKLENPKQLSVKLRTRTRILRQIEKIVSSTDLKDKKLDVVLAVLRQFANKDLDKLTAEMLKRQELAAMFYKLNDTISPTARQQAKEKIMKLARSMKGLEGVESFEDLAAILGKIATPKHLASRKAEELARVSAALGAETITAKRSFLEGEIKSLKAQIAYYKGLERQALFAHVSDAANPVKVIEKMLASINQILVQMKNGATHFAAKSFRDIRDLLTSLHKRLAELGSLASSSLKRKYNNVAQRFNRMVKGKGGALVVPEVPLYKTSKLDNPPVDAFDVDAKPMD